MEGSPLEIVLPVDAQSLELPVYLANSINLLSALKDEPPEKIIKRVSNHNFDILNIRNLDTGEYTSITLRLAANQIREIKRLVTYSACSEKTAKPHFNDPLKVGHEMTEHFRFGHTFSGSFGFTIESQVRELPIRHRQMSLLPEMDVEDIIMLPPERRVMERIVRGLITTSQATQKHDPRKLIEDYPSGFNSNMCDAIVRMFNDGAAPLEYGVLWSPRIKPSDDVSDIDVIHLNENSYFHLHFASEILKSLEPEIVTIQGLVISLSSQDDPLSNRDINRSIMIKWTTRPTRPINVVVFLSRDDYVLAHDAHLNWKTVEVSGIIQKVGNVWQLCEYRDFRLTGRIK